MGQPHQLAHKPSCSSSKPMSQTSIVHTLGPTHGNSQLTSPNSRAVPTIVMAPTQTAYQLKGLFEPTTTGYFRHRFAVTATSMIMLAAACGAGAVCTYNAGRWLFTPNTGAKQEDSKTPSS